MQILVDLQYMIGVYRELKGEIGKDVFQLDNNKITSIIHLSIYLDVSEAKK